MALEELGPPARKWLFILQSFISSLRTRLLHVEVTKALNWWYDRANYKVQASKSIHICIIIYLGVSKASTDKQIQLIYSF